MRRLWEKDSKSKSRPSLPNRFCSMPLKRSFLEIEIPPQLTEPLLQYASETELPVEDIVETALRNYLERSQDNA